MPKMPKFWCTEHEMHFLDGLGSYKTWGVPAPRTALLWKYYEAAKRRERWDHVDREKILKRVAGELGGLK
jgi:hypothetical protein